MAKRGLLRVEPGFEIEVFRMDRVESVVVILGD